MKRGTLVSLAAADESVTEATLSDYANELARVLFGVSLKEIRADPELRRFLKARTEPPIGP